MKLVDYIEILWRRKWIIALVVLVVLPVVILGSRRLTPTYATSAKIRISTVNYGADDWLGYDVRYSERLTATYVEIAKTDPVINKLLARLDVEVKDLPKMDIRLLPATEIIEITAESTNKELAQKTANELADIMVEQEIRFEFTHELAPYRQPSIIVEKAGLPSTPRGIGSRTFIALGAVMGLIGGVGLALLFESIDPRLHAARHVAGATNLPLLGTIPNLKRSKTGKKETSCDNALRLALRLFPPDKPAAYKTLLLVSAIPAEGRTTVLAELALALADSGLRVVMVDANLRKPALHDLFQLENTRGLSDILQNNGQLADMLQVIATDKPLSLLPGGTPMAQPARLFAGDGFTKILDALSAQFDVVLIDTPPMAAAPDALFLAGRVNAVLPLLSRGQTPYGAFREIQQQLKENGAILPGFIINRAPKHLSLGSYNAAHADLDTLNRQNAALQ
jgi:capsular exopolysaccharide synthesis family protein